MASAFVNWLSVRLLVGLLAGGVVGLPSQSATAAAGADGGGYDAALADVEAGNFADAVTRLERVLEADPNYLPARILLGESLLALGNAQGAEAQLTQALLAGGDAQLILVPLGQAYLLQSKADDVIREIRADGGSAAFRADIANLRGFAFLETGQLTEARAAFTQAEELRPSNPTPAIGLARIALMEGDVAAAGRLADQAFQRESNGAVWRLRGELAALAGRPGEALRAYSNAIDLAWGDINARIARAILLIDQEELEAAKADLDVVRQIVPRDLEALYLSALIEARQGRTDDAETLLRTAERDIDKILPQAMSNNRSLIRASGLIHYALGNFTEAAAAFEQLAERSPGDDTALVLAARARIRMGEYATAIRMLETALTIRDVADTHGLLGAVYTLRGEHDAALEELGDALAANSESARLRYGLALLNTQNPEEATALLNNAEDSDNLASLVLLALAQMQAGNYEAAANTSAMAVAEAPQSPYVRNIAALTYINAERFADARAELSQALKLERNFVPALLNRARLDVRDGKLKEAIEGYQTVLRLDRGNTAAMLELVDLALTQNRRSDAEEQLQLARDENPDSAEVWARAISYEAETGRIDTAREMADDFLRRNPNSEAIGHLIAMELWRRGELEDAKRFFQSMLETSLDRSAVLYRVGLINENLGQPEEAAESFRRALAWSPDSLEVWQKLILLEASMKDIEEALRLTGELEDRRIGADIQVLKGQLYLAAGRFEDSLTAFRAGPVASRADPARAIGEFEAMMGLGRTQAAIDYLRDWLERHQTDSVIARLATAYADQGNLQEALRLQGDLLQRNPGNISVLNNMALLALANDDLPAARRHADEALRLAPDNPAIMDTAAWIRVQEGDARGGLAMLREAQARTGGDSRIRYHMAVALMALGRTEEARRELEEALIRSTDFRERAEAEALLAEIRGR